MKTIPGVIMLATVLLAGTARGQFLVDTGTPDATNNAAVFFISPSFAQVVAQKFTLTQDATVTKIEAFMKGFGQPATVELTNKNRIACHGGQRRHHVHDRVLVDIESDETSKLRHWTSLPIVALRACASRNRRHRNPRPRKRWSNH